MTELMAASGATPPPLDTGGTSHPEGRRMEAVRTAAIVGVFLLGAGYALEVGQAMAIPVVMALLLEFQLRPAVRWLRHHGVPEPAGAGLLLVTLLVVVGSAAFALAAPAAEWAARAPASLAKVERRLQRLATPLAKFQETAARVEQVATPTDPPEGTIRIRAPSFVERASGSTVALVEGIFSIAFLSFFLLASGDRFILRLVELLPRLSDKKKAVRIARDIERQISTYLSTVTALNIGLGLATWLGLALLGMPNAALWGFVAAVLNYIPYLGAFVTVVVIGIAALATFDDTGRALAMPFLFLVLHTIEANVVKPMMLGRRLPLNETALFVGLMFWWYLWGVVGAILAVPILVAFKALCDHLEMLRPIGRFLGHDTGTTATS